jgi:hypothetical protein
MFQQNTKNNPANLIACQLRADNEQVKIIPPENSEKKSLLYKLFLKILRRL